MRWDFLASVAAYAERVGDTIDVVEPRSDERDLKNALVVEPDCSQSFVVRGRDSRRILRKLDHKVEHRAILI